MASTAHESGSLSAALTVAASDPGSDTPVVSGNQAGTGTAGSGDTPPRIVVVGGGAGGLELATTLGRKLGRRGKAVIHLVDKTPAHLWKPLLHEVATGSLDSGIDEVSYLDHARHHGFRFHMGALSALDRVARRITLAPLFDSDGVQLTPERHLGYDYLVIAVGSQTNDFGTPGADRFCEFLDSREQADRFHRHLISTFLTIAGRSDARESGDAMNREAVPKLRVGIVGAGATGVELAAELYNTTSLLQAYGLQVGPEHLLVTILEAGPRILPALPERISQAVVVELEKLGTQVRTNTRITQVDEQGFVTADGGRIDADLRVWAAGVKAPPFLQGLAGLETNRINQLIVEPTLQTTRDPRILAIGDCAACPMEGGGQVPPRAQSAHQMATHAFRNLRALLRDRPLTPYRYRDHGSLISLSRYSTVGSLMGNLKGRSVMVEGRIARLVYISLYRLHQIALHGLFRTGLIVLSARLNRTLRPRLKLH